MDALGSVKNRLKTMLIISHNKKLKLEKENKILKKQKEIVISNKKIEQKEFVTTSNKDINQEKKNNFILRKAEVSVPSVAIKKEIKANTSSKISKKSSTLCDEESIKIKENFKSFIEDSKKEIKKLKNNIEKEEKNIKNIKTQKELEEYQERLEKIKEKINYLKELYEGILNKYEFSGFEEISDSLLSKYIDDFKFKNSISEIDLLVDVCKNEITYLEEINKLVEKIDKISVKEKNKKAKITYLDNDYYNRMIDYNKLVYQENKINRYIEKEEEYLINLEKEIENNSLETIKKSLNIGLSLFNTTFIGAFIGAFLVKNSLTPLLLNAFDRGEIIKYNYKYNEYISKITDNLSIIRQANFLLSDSLKGVSSLKRHMETEYKEYLETKTYKELYNKIIYLEKNLIKKQNQNLKLEENLLEQKSKNNEKQKKLEEMYGKK